MAHDSEAEPDEPVQGFRFPDFICIGAQKAGTTWLDRNLRRHPKLWLPPIKELQYFNDLYLPPSREWTAAYRRDHGRAQLHRYIGGVPEENWNYRHIAGLADIINGPISDDWYGRIFSLTKPEQICGEVSPDYAGLPEEGIRHILRLAPDVRIVLSLRDPIERSWSHLRMLARTHHGSELSQLEQFARLDDLVQRTDYPGIIARWRKHVSNKRFLVVFMDDIASKPVLVLEQIFAFLGTRFPSRRFWNASDPVHVGQEMEIPPSIYAIFKERLRPIYEGITVLYPEIGAAWWERHY
jgi:hypothetical protein